MKQRGFAPVLIVLILALVAGYFVYTNYSNNRTKSSSVQTTQTFIPSPTPDPHPDWKKYHNENLNFSFRYPQNWKINAFQVNGFGLTAVNEKDQEMFIMYDTPPSYYIIDIDPSIIVKKSFQIGKDSVNRDCYDDKKSNFVPCEVIEVMFSSGKKLNLEIKDINLTTVDVLKSMDGATLINPTPTPTVTGSSRTYQGDGVIFEYPATWKQQPGTANFNSRDGTYRLNFTTSKNYDEKTGKSYTDIKELVDEVIKEEYQPEFKKIVVAGQEAWQVSERTPYENAVSIVFFSKDLKNIFSFDFRTNTTLDKLDVSAQAGQIILDHTLATFKFTQ